MPCYPDLQATALARADRIRARLLKAGARIAAGRRRIKFASVYPLQRLFAHVLAALRAPPTGADAG